MDAEDEKAGGGVELTIISAVKFLRLNAKPRIPLGQHFRILAWVNRDRTHIQYFCRGRFAKTRHREKDKRDNKTDCSKCRSGSHQNSLLTPHPCQLADRQ